MKIVAVVGTGSGCGKTTIVCRILREIPGLGAVKISPREGESRIEWGAGEPGKDTDLYHGSGAAPVAMIIGPREAVGQAWERVKTKFERCRGVVIEGTGALQIPGERCVVFVVGDTKNDQREQRNRELAAISQVIIYRSSHSGVESSLDKLRAFLAGSAQRPSGKPQVPR
ncbi:MAG: P-loop NTPase family protein [Candidatus Methylomirabilia bacterium]